MVKHAINNCLKNQGHYSHVTLPLTQDSWVFIFYFLKNFKTFLCSLLTFKSLSNLHLVSLNMWYFQVNPSIHPSIHPSIIHSFIKLCSHRYSYYVLGIAFFLWGEIDFSPFFYAEDLVNLALFVKLKKLLN